MRVLLALAAILLVVGACLADPLIRLQNRTFDPAATGASVQGAQAPSERTPDGKGYYILQFKGPIEDAWKAEATAAGAELLDYIPDFAFVARADKSAESKLRALPSVRWLGDFAPDYRVSKKLGTDKENDVVIRLFPGADEKTVRDKVAKDGGQAYEGDSRVLRATLHGKHLFDVARTPGVAWIEPKPHYALSNNVARGIIEANTVSPVLGLYGAGQTVAVADTGLDTGNTTTLSPDFAGRLLKAYALGRKTPKDWSDGLFVNTVPMGGHGTHVAGSILGNGTRSGSVPATHSYVGSFAGVAPEATLVFQSVMDKKGQLGGIPYYLSDLFLPPYTDGARVHSDSWGDPTASIAGSYTLDAQQTDSFIWSHKDMVVCLAAGNSGTDQSPADGFVDTGSVESPSTAKNCITVGASEGNTTLGYQGTYGAQSWGLTTSPIGPDRMSNNPLGMAGFSSRGPTDDGRIKPDIVAPGTNIISCRSQASGVETLWGVQSTYYLFSGGTSMATPIVAGACALVREYYTEHGIAAPSAALVKATLVNGAFNMAPGQYPVPPGPQEVTRRGDFAQGWGRLDLKNTLLPAAGRFAYPTDATTGLSTGASSTATYYVASGSLPLRATLVWSDYQGSTIGSVTLVNDLDLSVTGPGGVVYRGNDFSGSGARDNRNNVEGVDIAVPVPGLYTVSVQAYNVPQGPQPFALVVSGAVTASQPISVSTLSAVKALDDGALITLTGKSAVVGTDSFFNRFYIEETDRSSGICVTYGVGGGPVVHEGDVVTVTGTLATVGGERVIKDPIVN
jgi:subtilisin family serine protease